MIKELLDNPIYLKSIKYDSMPHNPNSNSDGLLTGIVKMEEKIENINHRIDTAIEKLNSDLMIFEKIDKMLKELTNEQRQAFVLMYKEKMNRIETAYTLKVDDRTIQNWRQVIYQKSNFIQE